MSPHIVEMKGSRITFSCGCETDRIGENFIIKPCSLDCEVYQYALEQSRKRGNEISFQVTSEDQAA